MSLTLFLIAGLASQGLTRQECLHLVEYLQLVPRIVSAAHGDVLAFVHSESDGPLMVDTISFASPPGLPSVRGVRLADLRRVLDPRAQLVSSGTEDCEQPLSLSCRIRGNGVFVRLDSLAEEDGTVVAWVTSLTTFRSLAASSLCPRTNVLRFRRGSSDWVMLGSMLVRTC